MPQRTVIDELVVKLGLDPRDFTKGEKEAAASVLRTEKVVKGSAERMSDSFTGSIKNMASSGGILARAASAAGPIGIAIAAIGVGLKIANDMLYKVAENIRDLANDSRRLDTSAAALRNWQNVAEKAGGTAEGVTSTIGGLQKSLYDLSFNGQMSGSLQMLGRLGVQFQDVGGHMRSFTDIALDAAGAVEALQKNGTMNEAEAIAALGQAGFDPGLALVLSKGRASASAELSTEAARRQVNGQDIAQASGWTRSSISKGQAAFAEAGVPMMATAATADIAANQGMEGLITGGARGAGAALDGLTHEAEKASTALADVAEAAIGLPGQPSTLKNAAGRQGAWFREKYVYRATIEAAAKQNGMDPALLAGLLRTESGFNPDARSPAGAVGVAQLMPKYFPGAGKDPHRDIYTAAEYLKKLHDSELANDPIMSDNNAWNFALGDYNAGQARVRESLRGGRPLAQETMDYPGKVLGYAEEARARGVGGGGGSSTVSVGEVNVYTQATDANGMADGAAGALTRKLSAAQSEQGMQ